MTLGPTRQAGLCRKRLIVLAVPALVVCGYQVPAQGAQGRVGEETSTSSSAVPLLAALPSAVSPCPLFPCPGPLPESPASQTAPQASRGSVAGGTASLSGILLDGTGAALANAQVTLAAGNGMEKRSIRSGAHGEFYLPNLPAGSYSLTVEAPGFRVFQANAISLADGQTLQLPEVTLTIATATTEITVRPTEIVAEEQMKAEERQRIIGIVPNFYTSYIFDAAPMTVSQKYRLALRDTFDPIGFVGTAVAAGVEQADNIYPGYGNGTAGYAKRFAAAYGDGLFGDLLSHAVFPQIFHEDPRYFYQGTGTRKSRLLHALSFAVIARSDTGKPMPNYPYFLGDIAGGLISNLYYPHADRGIGPVFISAATGLGGRAVGSVIREFASKHFTTNVPGNGQSRP